MTKSPARTLGGCRFFGRHSNGLHSIMTPFCCALSCGHSIRTSPLPPVCHTPVRGSVLWTVRRSLVSAHCGYTSIMLALPEKRSGFRRRSSRPLMAWRRLASRPLSGPTRSHCAKSHIPVRRHGVCHLRGGHPSNGIKGKSRIRIMPGRLPGP